MIRAGFSAQLLLEAAMLQAGAFESLPAALADDLIYWRFAATKFAPRAVDCGEPAAEAGAKALNKLRAQLAYYQNPDNPFLSQTTPLHVGDVGDYDHLARRAEWVDLGAAGE
jgi:ATP-dependent helicase/nuclease subunit B